MWSVAVNMLHMQSQTVVTEQFFSSTKLAEYKMIHKILRLNTSFGSKKATENGCEIWNRFTQCSSNSIIIEMYKLYLVRLQKSDRRWDGSVGTVTSQQGRQPKNQGSITYTGKRLPSSP